MDQIIRRFVKNSLIGIKKMTAMNRGGLRASCTMKIAMTLMVNQKKRAAAAIRVANIVGWETSDICCLSRRYHYAPAGGLIEDDVD